MSGPPRIGRYHNAPKIGWTARELVWLEAAMTLSAVDFFYACEDIASMSGRTVAAVTQKVKEIKRDRDIQARVKPKITSPGPLNARNPQRGAHETP